jgi:hypothetical protein
MSARFGAVVGVLAVLFTAGPAWAVVINANVKSSNTGEPVGGATIRIGGNEFTSDDKGSVTLELDDARIGQRVEYEVIYEDGPGTARRVRHQSSFVVRSGATLNIQIPVGPSRIVPPMSRTGGGRLGGVIGFSVGTQDFDAPLGSQAFTSAFTPGTLQLLNRQGSLTPDEISRSNMAEQKKHSVGPSSGVSFDLALPGVGRGLYGAAIPGSSGLRGSRRTVELARDMGAGGDVGASAQGGRQPSMGWRFYPALTVAASHARMAFESRNVTQPAGSFEFKGDGLLVDVGGNAVLFPCAGCGWYTSVGYSYSRTGDIEMTRTPGLQALVPAGARAVSDRGEYRYWAHMARGAVGHTFAHVAPWVGARGMFRRARLSIESEVDVADLTRVLGARQMLAFRNDFERNTVEGIAGLDVRIPRTRAFVRVEGSSNGENTSFSVGFAYGFFR